MDTGRVVNLSPRWRTFLKAGLILISLMLVGVGFFALSESLEDITLSGLTGLWLRQPVRFWLIWAGLNLLVILFWAWRWGVILQALGLPVSLKKRVFARLAGFGWSYFTPGPQIGGEPVQVYLVARDAQLPLSSVMTSVYLDRLIDGLTNFAVLAAGVLMILFLDMEWAGGIRWLSLSTGLVLIVPVAHFLLLMRGETPLTRVLLKIRSTGNPFWIAVSHQVILMESHLGDFAQQHTLTLIKAFLISVLSWLVSIGEFAWLLSGLSDPLSLLHMLRFLILARFSFLLPVPAAVGIFESAMVFAAVSLGLSPVIGVALGLTIRIRDVLLGLIGVLISGSGSIRSLFHFKREVAK
ncbi:MULTISPECIES: lysylphosphatidylglycerol synthase transmembrane domain-containing protein [Anaerolinea]|uniref:lysylphosphatidylglycerol synthase transmembrane domain-containing protein n=1 Tax=Anaerolinea TaxID=233189 RepID=UPI002627E13F|nr:lysylphosphatidylglycerol synthase transmembrane domain-containing protein [Anaerolinea thermophila]